MVMAAFAPFALVFASARTFSSSAVSAVAANNMLKVRGRRFGARRQGGGGAGMPATMERWMEEGAEVDEEAVVQLARMQRLMVPSMNERALAATKAKRSRLRA